MDTTQTSLQRQLADLIANKANLNEIRLLIAQGAKVNLPVVHGLTPLHYATHAKYEECLELLIIRGADLDATDEIGITSMHLAAEKGYLEIMQILIKAGGKVKFNEGNTMCQMDEPLRLAIKNNHFECAKLLLEKGANPNTIYFMGTELNLACTLPSNVKFIELLLQFGAETETRNRSGLTPIMQVAQMPTGYEATKLLLKYNADVNCYAPEQEEHRSVLHYAVKSGNLSLLRLVLFCGANVVYPCEVLKKPSSLTFAIIKGDLNMVKLLIEFGAQLNTGCPLLGLPLHVALSKKIKNRKQIVMTLLENGADPNLITMDARGPCLKPPLGEYLNVDDVDMEIVRLLLKYNSRVIITAQVQHPLGMLKCVNRVPLNSLEESKNSDSQLDQVELNEKLAFSGDEKARLFYLLVNACELFNIMSIRRCTLLKQNQKRVLLAYATTPPNLKHLSRLSLRRYVFKFAQSFFNDDQNASSAHYALENRFNQQQNSPELRSKSFDYNTKDLVMDNWQNHDLRNDSYLYNKNSYKKYVGNRYQKCVNRIEEKLFYRPNSKQKFYFKNNKLQLDSGADDKPVFNQSFAVSFGLTSEEMEIVKMRHEHQLNEQKNTDCSFNRPKFSDDNNRDLMDGGRKAGRNTAQLPVGYRLPPGCQWPIRLIDLDSKFNEYNFRYYSSLNSASTLIDQLREYFNFDASRFKCANSFAVHLLGNLPIPIYLRRYVLYEDE